MFDVSIVQYFGLTGGGCRSGLEVLVQIRVVSRSWTRCCKCWLQRLCDRCPGLFNPGFNRVNVDVASSVDASPNSESLVD